MLRITIDIIAFVIFFVIFFIAWSLPELVVSPPKTLEKPAPTEEDVFIPTQFSSDNFPSKLFLSSVFNHNPADFLPTH